MFTDTKFATEKMVITKSTKQGNVKLKSLPLLVRCFCNGSVA